MKTTFSFFLTLLLAGTAAAIDSRHSYVTEHELQGFGDFNGDGLLDAVVVDRASGNYRVGTQVAGGLLQWGKAKPSGVAGADAMAAGRVISTTKDRLLVAGKFANRVNLIAPDAPFASPIALALESLGPISVTAIDINFPGNDPARHDLVAITDFNSGGSEQAVFRSTAAGITKISEGPSPKPIRRTARVFPSENATPWLGYLEFDGTTNTETFVIGNTQTPAVNDIRTLPGLEVDSDYLAAPLKGGNANQVVFWRHGAPTLRLAEISAGPTLASPVAHDLGAAIDSVFLIRTNTRVELFVVFGDGGTGSSYRLDAAGVPVAGQSFTAPTGRRINGVLGAAVGQLALLTGPAAGGPSTRVQNFAHNGTQWISTGGEDLPPVGPAAAGTNIFLYDSEPLVNPDAKLVQTLQIADWSSALVISGGANPTASLVAETFGSSSAGLGAAVPNNLGSVASAVRFGLPNQIFPQASLSTEGGSLGLAVPAVTISPPAGEYDRYITPVLISDAPSLFYRVGFNPWSPFPVGGKIINPFADAQPFTVYFYAASGASRTPIYRADYRFSGEPGTLDTDGDGVPDFVESRAGLDPTGQRDSDGDGHADGGSDSDLDGSSDLTELLLGSDPNNAASTPAPGSAPIDFGNLYDLALKPLSHDGLPAGGAVNASWALSNVGHTPTNIRLFALGGELLAQAATEINAADNLVGPSAYLAGLPSDGADLFTIAATDATFDTKPEDDTASGRELLKLVAVPRLAPPRIPAAIDPASESADDDWIAAAQAYFAGRQRPRLEDEITYEDSLDLLVFERVLNLLTGSPFSLTGFRDPAPLGEPDLAALLALQTNAAGSSYLLQTVFTQVKSLVDANANLRNLAAQLYQISAANGDADPGKYPNPFDTLRAALRGTALPASYATGVTANLSTAAAAPAQFVAALVPRPVATFSAVVLASSFDVAIPVVQNTAGGGALRLFDAGGAPFVFPRGIDLPPGASLQIVAFTDRGTLPPGPGLALETISATLIAVPAPPRQDRDGDLLDDAWADHYFPTGGSAFADPDGDGYSTFQEMLENTNPTAGTSRPSVPPLALGPPPIDIEPVPPGEVRLFVHFPSRYANAVGFALLKDDGRAIRFGEVDSNAAPDGSDTFGLRFSPPADARSILFRFRMFLKP